MSRYRFSEKARDDLRAIVDHVTDESGPGRAAGVVRSLFDALERIAEMPGIGHRREDLTGSDLRFWPVFSYLIVYRPASSPLEVVRVLHGRQDIKMKLEDD